MELHTPAHPLFLGVLTIHNHYVTYMDYVKLLRRQKLCLCYKMECFQITRSLLLMSSVGHFAKRRDLENRKLLVLVIRSYGTAFSGQLSRATDEFSCVHFLALCYTIAFHFPQCVIPLLF